MELKGKTAVITGGASGIGLATAKRFASSGANLVLGDIEDQPLQAAVAALRSNGANVIGVQGDVAQEDDVVAPLAHGDVVVLHSTAALRESCDFVVVRGKEGA